MHSALIVLMLAAWALLAAAGVIYSGDAGRLADHIDAQHPELWQRPSGPTAAAWQGRFKGRRLEWLVLFGSDADVPADDADYAALLGRVRWDAFLCCVAFVAALTATVWAG